MNGALVIISQIYKVQLRIYIQDNLISGRVLEMENKEVERMIKIYNFKINNLNRELELEEDYEEKKIIAGQIFEIEDMIKNLKKAN